MRKLPPGFAERSCRADIAALAIQRKRQFRGPLGELVGRVGRRCTPSLKKALSVPIAAAGPELAAAAKICEAEYNAAAGLRP